MPDQHRHYTLVRHSAWMVRKDRAFENAVEMQRVDGTKRQLRAILAAGGLLFETYDAATKAEYETNYPPGTIGLIARADGVWKTIGTLLVFVPARPEAFADRVQAVPASPVT